MMTPDQTVRLRDGRTLGYADYGNPKGRPLLFFHGTPGSRLFSLPQWDDRNGPLRVIVPDRPGMGLSDYQPHRRLLDWPDDVAQLADHLELDRFAVAGVSGGGPHALVCAYKLPDRVAVAASLSGAASMDAPDALVGMHAGNRTLMKLARSAPWLLGVLMWPTARLSRAMPDRYMEKMLKVLPEADQRVLQDPEILARVRDSDTEATRNGIRGVVQETKVFVQPWGFSLEDITVPVQIWQGTEDRNVPVAMGERLGREIPNATVKILPGEGHMLSITHWDEIVQDLVAAFPN
jgi:pimeloyl-ACP methyl ester carboxylesterase